MKKDERRRRARIPLTQPLRHSTYQVLGTPVFQDNSTIDFSSKGISFETPREYKKGSLVLLELPLEGSQSGPKIKILVSVAWCRSAGNGQFKVGAELVAIDPSERKILQAHIAKYSVKKRSKKAPKKLPKNSTKAKSKKKLSKKSSKKKKLKKTRN